MRACTAWPGPTFEVLFQAGWTPPAVDETARPRRRHCGGSGARRLGPQQLRGPGGRAAHARLCAISLSDLLTPWPTIARRLDAVAYSDFVVALYNPKAAAARGRLWKRSACSCATAALIRPWYHRQSAYRRRERIEFTTLAHMSDADIGMLSTVLIGNSNTVVQNGLMVTPRGYANKYDVQAGAPRARASAQAGRSPPGSTAG